MGYITSMLLIASFVLLGIAIYQKFSKRIIVPKAGWIALGLFVLALISPNYLRITEKHAMDSGKDTGAEKVAKAEKVAAEAKKKTEADTKASEVARKEAEKIAKEEAELFIRRKARTKARMKTWKNELKIVIKEIDRDINVVKRMLDNSEEYEENEIYDNLRIVANNMRVHARNINHLKEIDFENSEDNKLKDEVISWLHMVCVEYEWAYDKVADNMQKVTVDPGRFQKEIDSVRFGMIRAKDALIEATSNLTVLLNKYGLKF